MVSLAPWLELLPVSMPLLDLTALLPQVSGVGMLLVGPSLQAGLAVTVPTVLGTGVRLGIRHIPSSVLQPLSPALPESSWNVWANPEAETFSIPISLGLKTSSGPC